MAIKAQGEGKAMDPYKGKVLLYCRNSAVLIWTRLLEGFNTQGNHNKNIFKNHCKRNNQGISMVNWKNPIYYKEGTTGRTEEQKRPKLYRNNTADVTPT